MKKINWKNRKFWLTFSIIISFGFVIFIIVIKSLIPFKPSFYTYSSYTDPQTVKEINKHYTYKEYGTVSDFEYAFENNKAIAGVTSDYSIISLIKDKKIAPISKEICDINELNLDEWENYFSEASKEQMNQYDQYLIPSSESDELYKLQLELHDLYPDYDKKRNFKFSDFVVPYFINDKVLAFDTKKLMNKVNLGINPFEFSDKHPSLVEALDKLDNQLESAKIQWTKNERENTVLGSTKNNPEEWDTKITNDNYMDWINNFANMVLLGTGKSMSNTSKNLFDNDSDIILNNLINPESKINVAMIYNGDALDAYYGNDNFQEITDGDRIRIVRTKYTIRVLDCFVVSSSINKEDRFKLLTNFNDTLFNGMFKDKEELTKMNEQENIYRTPGIIRIFDYVNYTPAAKGAYEFILDNYFNDDEIAKNIYQVANNDPETIYVKGVAPIEKSVLSKLVLEFQKKLNGY